ncbi:flavin reductase family protein [Clostridium perfringens]|nr:flavin reductase family protein [Clostridium perfringens]
MSKVKFNKLPLVYPIPSVLIGTVINDKPNFATIGNCGIISVNPAVIYISMEKNHYTNKGIRENQVFSINIPSADLVDKVDYCGLVSGNNIDKSQIFKCFYESNNKIPMIDECPINMECKVTKIIEIYDMEVFIGEIIETYVNQDLLTNGFPDTKKINPLIYSMDNNYWEIGDFIGNAFNIGKNIK